MNAKNWRSSCIVHVSQAQQVAIQLAQWDAARHMPQRRNHRIQQVRLAERQNPHRDRRPHLLHIIPTKKACRNAMTKIQTTAVSLKSHQKLVPQNHR